MFVCVCLKSWRASNGMQLISFLFHFNVHHLDWKGGEKGNSASMFCACCMPKGEMQRQDASFSAAAAAAAAMVIATGVSFFIGLRAEKDYAIAAI